ncbi:MULTISPECIES: hypothetical protein [Streptomyces]
MIGDFAACRILGVPDALAVVGRGAVVRDPGREGLWRNGFLGTIDGI